MDRIARGARYVPVLLATIVFLLPFERIPSLHLHNVTIRLSQIAALILMLLVAGWLVRNWRRFIQTPVLWLTLFLLSYLLSTGLAISESLAVKTFIFTGFTILAGILFSFFASNETLPKLQKALLASTWVVLIFGLYQYFGDLAGLSTHWTRLAPNYVKAVFGFPRVQSTALEPLYFASFLLIPLCILSARWLAGKYQHKALLLLTTLLIILTVSRGAVYGGVCAVTFLTLTMAINRQVKWASLVRYVATIAAAVLIAVLMTKLPESSKGLQSASQRRARSHALASQTFNFNSMADRTRNRMLAVDAFKSRPIFGIGPGNFDTYAKAHFAPYQASQKVIVNNETLEILAEGGLVGAGLLLAFFVQLFYLGWRAMRRVSAELQPWLYGLMAYLIATAIQYQTFSTLYIMHIWVATGILLGVISLVQNKSKTNGKQRASAEAKS